MIKRNKNILINLLLTGLFDVKPRLLFRTYKETSKAGAGKCKQTKRQEKESETF